MKKSNNITREKGLDHSITLLSEGYQFIPKRTARYGTDLFQTRLLGQKVICMSGQEAAKMFYDKERFQRDGAAPKRIQKTLFGENGIQTMDGSPHEHRKQLFMSLMTDSRLQRLGELTKHYWEQRAAKWKKKDKIVLFNEAQEVLCQAACEWAGVPIKKADIPQRAADFSNMVDAFGAVGPRHWRGRKARARAEKWIRQVIKQIRSGKLKADEESAAYAMAFHKDLEGKPLNISMAAIELINVLRPIVAIATYITFGALALHKHPELHDELKDYNEDRTQMFIQEVRRYYPFGPFLGARVRRSFIWNQCHFNEGQLVLLDIYGTNHDSRLWKEPYTFTPKRFKDWNGGLFDLIPQGGGDYYKNHRCPGEWATIEAMKASLNFLHQLNYKVPKQNLNYSMVRMPTLPKSKFIMTNVELK